MHVHQYGPLMFMAKFDIQSFVNPQYELVVLHPEHFLPNGCPLTVYDHATEEYKNYVAAEDRCLRETIDPSSHLFPPFYHTAQDREMLSKLNVYLVALNAEIKLGRYFEMVDATPPTTPLPDHVLSLMRRTIELVDLLYWVPTPTKGSEGEKVLAKNLALSRRNPGRSSRPGTTKTTEKESSEELEIPEEGASHVPSKRRKRFQWPPGMDLAARKAYGRALMSGHGMLSFAFANCRIMSRLSRW